MSPGGIRIGTPREGAVAARIAQLVDDTEVGSAEMVEGETVAEAGVVDEVAPASSGEGGDGGRLGRGDRKSVV